MKWKRGISQLGPTLLLGSLFVLGAIGLQHLRWQKLFASEGAALERQAEFEEEQKALQVQLLQNLPTLGFRNLLSDWAFLQFLQYFGNREQRLITGYDLADDYFEAVIKYDPYHFEPYIFISSTMSLFAAQPERGIELQKQGLESLTPQTPPESYFIWRQIGIDQLLFLGDAEASSASHEMAADWAAQSPYPRAEESERLLRRTAEFLKTDPDSAGVRVSAWLQVLTSAPDAQARDIAVSNIESLGYDVIRIRGGYTAKPRATAGSSD